MDTMENSPDFELLALPDKQVYLVGSAHVSQKSADAVERVITEFQPNSVCVELCESRFHSLMNPNRWQETDVFEVIKTKRTYVLLTQLVLAGFQKRLSKNLNVSPGEEMRRAIALAKERGAQIALIDRDVRITLKRVWGTASLWSLIKVMGSLLCATVSEQEISEEDIEKLKSQDVVTLLVDEFSRFLPSVKEVLIDERDLYMAAKIAACQGPRVVAVVGAGHVSGISRHIHKQIDLTPLETVPPPRKSLLILGWSVPVLILAFFIYGFFAMGAETSKQMVAAWILSTGVFSALGALVALPHPLTILAAFGSAPITALHPAIASGWVAGLVEAIIRKPKVRDLESLGEDITSFRGLWRNQVTKILLVVITTNLGTVVGVYLGAAYIVSLF